MRLPLIKDSPTAQISLAETTATLERLLSLDPIFGLETTFQLEPFQCSISVLMWLVVLGVEFPTAQTSLAETAATPVRTLSNPGFGLETTFHVEPFQCSMIVWE